MRNNKPNPNDPPSPSPTEQQSLDSRTTSPKNAPSPSQTESQHLRSTTCSMSSHVVPARAYQLDDMKEQSNSASSHPYICGVKALLGAGQDSIQDWNTTEAYNDTEDPLLGIYSHGSYPSEPYVYFPGLVDVGRSGPESPKRWTSIGEIRDCDLTYGSLPAFLADMVNQLSGTLLHAIMLTHHDD
ncbi:hypothetical protein PSPO01_00631 [Paraphaeosphaeria sporulosa]